MSILKPKIVTHSDIGDIGYAWIVNVFLVCCAVMYLVSGVLVNRFGSGKVMFTGIVAGSQACIGGGLATNVAGLTICGVFRAWPN